METNFDPLVASLSKPPISTDVIYQLTSIIKQKCAEPLESFISQSFQSLLTLERWAWELFSEDSLQWVNQSYYIELFHALASFNKLLIFTSDKIEDDIKAALLLPETIDQLNQVFKHIEQSDDDNNPYITIINLWFDNHSYFIRDHSQYNTLSVIDHIAEYFVKNYTMNHNFKCCLSQLRQLELPQSLITPKMLFYIKTCSFYLYTYLDMKNFNFYYTADEMVRYLGEDYLQIIHIHSPTVASWSKDLLGCITHLIAFLCRCCWWGGQTTDQMKILFPTEQITCEYIENLMQIIVHAPHYEEIKAQRSNEQTILLEACLLFILDIIQKQSINWLFRSNTTYQKIILDIAETSVNDIICVSAYDIMSTVLSDEQMKELKITDSAANFSFTMLEQAWNQPSKMYKQIPIYHILEGLRNLSKNDSIQQKVADLNKIPLFIEMCDQYPITFDILWGLSFNQDIQQQLRSNSTFISKLSHLAKESDNEQMRKIIHGILWNLEINHEDRSTSIEESFDIMISYSHKDEVLCRQIYDELIKAGYRIWIDFDQMHGNVMDAMAQAIERSPTVIICMSDDYLKSNYCRAEANYAFQRQRKIIPVLVQKHYRPDGWLLFLIGQLLYIDFHKYDLSQAMAMLFKELKVVNIIETNQPTISAEEETEVVVPTLFESTSKLSTSSLVLSQNILDWTSTNVQAWLIDHDLNQMALLLAKCNGRSLVYLNKYMRISRSEQVLKSLEADCLRRTGQDLSLIELSRFRSLMDEQKLLNNKS